MIQNEHFTVLQNGDFLYIFSSVGIYKIKYDTETSTLTFSKQEFTFAPVGRTNTADVNSAAFADNKIVLTGEYKFVPSDIGQRCLLTWLNIKGEIEKDQTQAYSYFKITSIDETGKIANVTFEKDYSSFVKVEEVPTSPTQYFALPAFGANRGWPVAAGILANRLLNYRKKKTKFELYPDKTWTVTAADGTTTNYISFCGLKRFQKQADKDRIQRTYEEKQPLDTNCMADFSDGECQLAVRKDKIDGVLYDESDNELILLCDSSYFAVGDYIVFRDTGIKDGKGEPLDTIDNPEVLMVYETNVSAYTRDFGIIVRRQNESKPGYTVGSFLGKGPIYRYREKNKYKLIPGKNTVVTQHVPMAEAVALSGLPNVDDMPKYGICGGVVFDFERKTFEKTTDIMENFLNKGELPFFVPGIRYRLAGMYNILGLYTKALECIYEVKYFYKDRRNKGNLSLGLESDLDIEYGYTLLRLNKTAEAYNILKKALEVKMKIRDKHDLFRGFVYLSETCLRLKKYDEFYKICKKCIPQDNCKYDKLLYLHYLYNIFIAQYKTNSNKIIDTFRNFFNYSKRIYYLFLNQNNIKELNDSSIGLDSIDSCLEYCRKMFIAIYGQEHSFVKNYLVKN